MVDFDEEVCRVARQRLNRASSCQSKVLTPEAFLAKALACECGVTEVICGRTDSPVIHQGMGLLNLSVGFCSPPCQPWAASGNSEGVQGSNGQAFLQMFAFQVALSILTLCC